MSKYCEACFAASTHTIDLVQQAYESNYLPQRNPFVLYFLFAASLIVLSNEFGSVYANPSISKKFVRLAGVGSYFCEQSNGGTTGAACDEDGKHPAPLIRNCGCIAGE
ncbi:hypothetical protein ACHAP1_003340 [Verticillium nonalfalfae]